MHLEDAGVESVEIAGPGFMNFRLDPRSVAESVKGVIEAGERFGKSDEGRGQPVNVEFVSANPTGPLHVGHGRQAALGDAIATLLEWTGWNVTREFYYNDAGAQIENLAASVRARIDQLRGANGDIPEGDIMGNTFERSPKTFSRRTTLTAPFRTSMRYDASR